MHRHTYPAALREVADHVVSLLEMLTDCYLGPHHPLGSDGSCSLLGLVGDGRVAKVYIMEEGDSLDSGVYFG